MLFRKKRTEQQQINLDIYNKEWYFDFLFEWGEAFSKTNPSVEQQNEFLDELAARIKANANNRNLQLLSDAEIDKFWQQVKKNLQFIDDKVLINHEGMYNLPLKEFLLNIKGSKLRSQFVSNDIISRTKKGVLFDRASTRNVFIEMMSYDRKTNVLTIMGCVTFAFDKKTTKLVAVINGKETILEDSGLYADYKLFGRTAYHKHPFTIEIPLEDTTPLSINFRLVSSDNSTSVGLRLEFNTYMSRLAGRITYWRFDHYVATHDGSAIHIKTKNLFKVFLREIAFLTLIATYWRRPRTAILRVLYWLTKPVYGKRNIWMYADKIYKAGDNAEWLYRYALKQKDDIHHYYTLRDDSPDAKKFHDDGIPFLKYKTIKQRLLFLHATIVVFTHNNAPGYYRFGGPNEVYFRGLYNYDIMYIQHGLTVQETSWLFKKSVDDFTRYFVASKFETENLLRPAYGFKPSEIVKAGAARYDGLVSNDKKNIIISPTWRTYLAPPGRDFGESRDAHQKFKDSEFYKIYNSLITNKKLISTAKKLGYNITYLLHPVMSSQIDDFDSKGYVKIVTANDDFNYQKAMTEASLMVTDYSGVQFDFAYMYKPVVYFHPPELPPSYEEAIYQYSKHALGDITTSLDELVNQLCDYMTKDCKIKPKYKKRIDEFFYHHDLNNCRRIYEEIIKWQSK